MVKNCKQQNGGKNRSSFTPKKMCEVIQRQSAMIEQKNRLIKNWRSDLQRSNRKVEQMQKKN
jgi:hypothetical protein